MSPTTCTHDALQPANRPTFYFIGVTTGQSSIRKVFPAWAAELGLGDVQLVGIDLALHAPAEHYRTVVEFLANDPLSLGGLVTTHKIDLYNAAFDLFDEIDPLAVLMGEVSSLAKRAGGLQASAKDPFSAGHALEAFIPPGHFAATGAELFVMGAGGSAIAIDWYLAQPKRGADRPARTIVSNRSLPRLERLREVHRRAGLEVPLETVHTPTPAGNDAVLNELSAGAVVVNATGLGKDAPGSPLSDAAVFPEAALVWDLNYRGDLLFLDQARRQQAARALQVIDGWVYFLHGWMQVIGEVFQIEIPTSGPRFERLAEMAAAVR